MIKHLINKYNNLKFNKKHVKVGTNSRILTSYLNFGSEPYLIEIGNNCTITSGVKFITHDATIDVVLNHLDIPRVTKKGKYEKMGGIKIYDNCVVGVNTIILQNVKIGPNSVVGAGSVVTRNVPPNTVVAGNPAKVICSLEEYVSKVKSKIVLVSEHKESIITNIISIPQ